MAGKYPTNLKQHLKEHSKEYSEVLKKEDEKEKKKLSQSQIPNIPGSFTGGQTDIRTNTKAIQ